MDQDGNTYYFILGDNPVEGDVQRPGAADESVSDQAADAQAAGLSSLEDEWDSLDGIPSDLDSAEIEPYVLGPVTSSTGLKGVLLELIGPYDGIVTQYRYQQSGNSYYTYVNDITPDYPWIFSAVLLIVLVHGLYKTIQRCFFR